MKLTLSKPQPHGGVNKEVANNDRTTISIYKTLSTLGEIPLNHLNLHHLSSHTFSSLCPTNQRMS